MSEHEQASWGPKEPEAPKEVRRPSSLFAALAAALPFLFSLGSCLFFGLATRGGAASILNAFQEMGSLGFLMVTLGAATAAIMITVLGFLSAKGIRIPSAISVGLAALPWMAGLVAAAMGMSIASDAVAGADASSKAIMMARGIAEASQARLLGAILSSGLFAAVGLMHAIGALNQRAPKRNGLIGAAVGLAALPFLAIALYGVSSVGIPGAVLLVAALCALLAVPLGAAGAGDDTPHGRSGALAASVPLAAGLSVTAAVVACSTTVVIGLFTALSMADPASRGAMLGRGVHEMGPLVLAGQIAVPLTFLVAAAVAAWAVSRARPSLGRIAGGVVLAVVALLILGADALLERHAMGTLAEVSQPAWGQVDDFHPISLPDDDEPSELVDGVVTSAGLFDLEGQRLAPLELAALTAAFRELQSTREERLESRYPRDDFYEEETPAWLEAPEAPPEPASASNNGFGIEDDDTGAGGALDREGTHPKLELAIDLRLDVTALRTTLEAAAAAGIERIVVQGVRFGAGSEEFLAETERVFPSLRAFVRGRGSVSVVPGPAVSEEEARADNTLLHAEVGATPPTVALAREGAHVLESDRLLTERTGYGRVDDGPPVFLGIVDGTTAEAVLQTAGYAASRGHLPVLVSGEIPGQPEQPALANLDRLLGGSLGSALGRLGGGTGDGGDQGGIGLGNVGTAPPSGGGYGRGARGFGGVASRRPQIRTGQADVRGSLSREVIRRVIRRHINEVRFCYEQQLIQQPELEGRVTVSFIISATGSVQSSSVADSTLNDSRVEQCITQAVRRWTFPAPDGGGIVVVRYPFVLTSG